MPSSLSLCSGEHKNHEPLALDQVRFYLYHFCHILNYNLNSAPKVGGKNTSRRQISRRDKNKYRHVILCDGGRANRCAPWGDSDLGTRCQATSCAKGVSFESYGTSAKRYAGLVDGRRCQGAVYPEDQTSVHSRSNDSDR